MHVEEPPPNVARWIFQCGKMAGKAGRWRVCGDGKKVMEFVGKVEKWKVCGEGGKAMGLWRRWENEEGGKVKSL